ncbi:MAG: phosphonate C-P lyase system protein PhnL [Pseudomonadota bacterium]
MASPDTNDGRMLSLEAVSKSFTMHLRGGVELTVFHNVSFDIHKGECAVLSGPSGIGKSSILKMIYGNYRVETGEVRLRVCNDWVNLVAADPRTIIAIRQQTLGYISQFLRVIPRVGARQIVAEAAIAQGRDTDEAMADAEAMLERLNLPRKLWELPPATFSGGEQQRVNIARGFIAHYPVLLLDEPTASLDAANASIVGDLVEEKKAAGVAMLGIFHDPDMRKRVGDRLIDVSQFAAASPDEQAA